MVEGYVCGPPGVRKGAECEILGIDASANGGGGARRVFRA